MMGRLAFEPSMEWLYDLIPLWNDGLVIMEVYGLEGYEALIDNKAAILFFTNWCVKPPKVLDFFVFVDIE